MRQANTILAVSLLLPTACVTTAQPEIRGAVDPCTAHGGRLETWLVEDGREVDLCRVGAALIGRETLDRALGPALLTNATTLFMGVFPPGEGDPGTAELGERCGDEQGSWTVVTRSGAETGVCRFRDSSVIEGLTLHRGFLAPGYRELGLLIEPDK